MENAAKNLVNHLGQYGFKSAVVSIHRLKDLKLTIPE